MPDPQPLCLAIIPARGGSKGLPGKNVLPLGGVPLLVYAIRCALASPSIGMVIVSTDSSDIAEMARRDGVEVVERPSELAADDSPTEDALLHVIDTLAARGDPTPDYVVTLEPTSPLRTPELVERCIATALELDADSVITVVESRGVWGDVRDGWFVADRPGEPRRRQLRQPRYRESSTVYVTRTTHLRESRSVLADRVAAVVVDPHEAVDINDAVDLALAEALLQQGAPRA